MTVYVRLSEVQGILLQMGKGYKQGFADALRYDMTQAARMAEQDQVIRAVLQEINSIQRHSFDDSEDF